jgi:hypothetical protein
MNDRSKTLVLVALVALFLVSAQFLGGFAGFPWFKVLLVAGLVWWFFGRPHRCGFAFHRCCGRRDKTNGEPTPSPL